MESIFRQLRSFQLGYTEERPYPWKWITPIVLSAFFLISVFLAALNVPLSAYNIVQEFTYRPNDTLPVVALSSLVPSMFQPSDADSFTPQLLTVGDIIRLNGSLLDYTIVAAFDGLDETKPVSSFSYYNNPFSDGCDVTNVTLRVGLVLLSGSFWHADYQMLVAVTCRIPTLFHLVWTGFPPFTVLQGLPLLEGIPAVMFNDFNSMFSDWSVSGTPFATVTQVNITVTVHPCCDCDTAASPETTTLLKPPCSSRPPQFMATEAQLLDTHSGPFSIFVMTEPAMMSTGVLEQLAGDLPNVTESVFNNLFQNIFQAIYHFVRLDLGIVVDNQIYSSPQMFNLSIMLANNQPSSYYPSTRDLRAATSNSTLMAQWRQRVAFYQNSDRVPIMDYLRPVPRLKPLASAITSVFVSTFAMLSVLWTIFSLGAGALARRTGQFLPICFITSHKICKAPQSERLSSTDGDLEGIGSKEDCGWDTSTSSSFTLPKEGRAPCQIPLQNLQNDVRELRRTLHGMQRLLEKQGLVVDTDGPDLDKDVHGSPAGLLRADPDPYPSIPHPYRGT
ncbi:hypothetical protein B0H14DRAFT_3885482, partial [Mycena olivaceomarginata]